MNNTNIAQIIFIGAGSLALLVSLVIILCKGLAEVTDIDEDEMTKTFDAMKAFDKEV